MHASHAASTAASGISSWQSTASCGGSTTSPRSAFAPGATTISVSPAASTRISATPVGSADSSQLERDARLAQPRESFVGERVLPDCADHRHLGAEPRARDRLVRAFPARVAREGRARDRLTRPRQALAARDEVEVDRPDDRDAGLQAASARRSSTVEPSSVSRRSKRPAQSDERSGAASRLAAVASPSSARTSTASSR